MSSVLNTPVRAAGEGRAAVLNIAHRGARAYAPENTLAAFAKAAIFDCPMFEIDVHMSRDGEVVVHHDDQLARCTDVASKFPRRSSYYVSDFTWSELSQLDAGSWFVDQLALPGAQRQFFLQGLSNTEQESYIGREDIELYASGEIRLPTLRQTLDLARQTGMMVNIELKMIPRFYPKLTDAVVDLIQAMEMTQQVLISSFDHEQLAAVRRQSRLIRTAVLTGDRIAFPGQYLKSLDAAAYHPGMDSLGAASLSGQLETAGVDDVLAAGGQVNVWTCNDKGQMQKLLAAGVTGLISDYPNRVNEAIMETGQQSSQ